MSKVKVSVDKDMMTMAAAFILGMANSKDYEEFNFLYKHAESTEDLNWQNMLDVIQKKDLHFCLSASLLNTIQTIFHDLYHNADTIGIKPEGEVGPVSCEEMVRSCTRDIVEHMLEMTEINSGKSQPHKQKEGFAFTDSKGNPVRF